MASIRYSLLIFFCLNSMGLYAQHDHHQQESSIDVQPLFANARRLVEALDYLGSPFSDEDKKSIGELIHTGQDTKTANKIQQIMDKYCLAVLHINPEGRVKADRGEAVSQIIENGWVSFLVKVYNDAGVTSKLEINSPNAAMPNHHPSWNPKVHPEDIVTKGEVQNRFLEAHIYNEKPMMEGLSGAKLEYAVVQFYASVNGKKEVQLEFSAGQGSQDIGFRSIINVIFDILPSVKVILDIRDEQGLAAMASFIITDSITRGAGKLSGVYPLPSRRVAAFDEYPDFFFQHQIYRKNGEHVFLPPGKYYVTYKRGPETLSQTVLIDVPIGKKEITFSFTLKRWINLNELGWYSADHHIHASGCSHYDSPEEGVNPNAMWRQVVGEDLNVAAVLSWGPSWYHQKQYFTGKDDSLSTKNNIMRYDVEVSGFPSSPSGHLVLLGIQEDDYPNTTKIEEWPTWTLPILKWAKQQGGIVGYAHSGWGLEPVTPTDELPNYIIPKMDGIGANEYVMSVAHNAVDFYSAGDTPAPWELNMWYHTLNCGFKTRLSGETDYPCITDEKLGQGRSYFKPDGPLSYEHYLAAIKSGRSYLSDGESHIMNFTIENQECGVKESLIKIKTPRKMNISADIAAYLPPEQLPFFSNLNKNKQVHGHFWHVESARIKGTRKVKVELIVNGFAVDTAEVLADGEIRNVKFSYEIKKSSWIAVRIYSSSHTNPIFIELNGKPILDKKSASWCIKSLDQCWSQKERFIRPSEKIAAKAAYDQAREVYKKMMEVKTP